jgi:hypothetical protein
MGKNKIMIKYNKQFLEKINFFDYYDVSKDGEVYNKRLKRLQKICIDGSGLSCIKFSIKGYMYQILMGRLMAIRFLNPNDNLEWEALHLDGNTLNNKLSNIKVIYGNDLRDFGIKIYSELKTHKKEKINL